MGGGVRSPSMKDGEVATVLRPARRMVRWQARFSFNGPLSGLDIITFSGGLDKEYCRSFSVGRPEDGKQVVLGAMVVKENDGCSDRGDVRVKHRASSIE